MVNKVFLIPAIVAAGAGLGAVTAPQARADCTYSGGVTICAQRDVQGVSGAPAPSSGPYYPYPCEDDWLCDDGGVSIILAPPGGDSGGFPDVGRPGRPGDRP
jgi:hypothetical protein